METTTTDVAVIGGGPGGYAAAFRAADAGKRVVLIDRGERLGGVCLNHGCIPSKALIHATKLIKEAKAGAAFGIHFEPPRVDLDELRAWKSSVSDKLAGGVRSIAKARGVELMRGRATFETSRAIRVDSGGGPTWLECEYAIVATGSRPAIPAALDIDDPRVITSAKAFEVEDVPDDLLVVGGGYIGMELGTVYAALGSRVVVVEALDSILPTVDPDLRRYVERVARKSFAALRTGSRVEALDGSGDRVAATVEGPDASRVTEEYDRVLVAVGRTPNTDALGLEHTAVELDARGFAVVDAERKTSDPTVYAIGDCAGGALLAHKAAEDATRAVQAICGEPVPADAPIIPAVVFTDPELAWVGLSEADAKAAGATVATAKFLWGASGRALTGGRPDGVTKIVIDPETERLLGVGMAGVGAGELIGEACVALHAGMTASQLADVVHPHPTLSETLMESAQAYLGRSIHTMPRGVRRGGRP